MAHFLRDMGADLVLDLQVAEQLAVLEQRQEFMEKFENRRAAAAVGQKAVGGPILTSSCPGWICYAEKTHGSWILPFVSRNGTRFALQYDFITFKVDLQAFRQI